MLNDRETEALREIEHRFLTEDPGFVRSFEAVKRQDSHYDLRWVYAIPRWVYTSALVAAIALGGLMLLAQAPGTALVFAALATLFTAGRRAAERAASGSVPGAADDADERKR